MPPAVKTSDNASHLLCIVALCKRDRARQLVRAAFPRRRAHVISAKSAADVEEQLVKELVDAVIIDAGAGDDAQRLIARADEFQSIPFVLITTLLPANAPLVAQATDAGVCDVIIEGIDDVAARDLVSRRAFSTRFERALSSPPPLLHLETPLQMAVWQSVVKRAGRPVRTDQLAKELSVSREHLSRSFAVGQAPTLKKVIDLVRVLAAAELSKNAGYDVRDVAEVLGFASSSHLSSTTQRLVGAKASSLSRLRAMDLLERFQRYATVPDGEEGEAVQG
ncbi:MAG: helix-turn-helix domain-containing protein [Gemmatimonadaceae bacterium]|uniref:helix-turn-helix domain-containing protein n=1 Tax=Gemmatimonas sp. TaxID=1962908 RepID=UPI001D6EF2D5|nr:helix-turn-helix domain-containing protein [Gemmatimonas sp.]NCW45681.1 helix-turn-helix domain-containing protein [Gemmatimonadaceae bacterium]